MFHVKHFKPVDKNFTYANNSLNENTNDQGYLHKHKFLNKILSTNHPQQNCPIFTCFFFR